MIVTGASLAFNLLAIEGELINQWPMASWKYGEGEEEEERTIMTLRLCGHKNDIRDFVGNCINLQIISMNCPGIVSLTE